MKKTQKTKNVPMRGESMTSKIALATIVLAMVGAEVEVIRLQL